MLEAPRDLDRARWHVYAAIMSKAHLIYISSLSHSGSTLLDFACSSSGTAVSLGEVYAVVTSRSPHDLATNRCSCGQLGADCPFWAELLSAFPTLNRQQKYERVIARAAEFSTTGYVIDSSKSVAGLGLANAFTPNVVHLTKDARAWAISQIDRAKRRGEDPRPPWRYLLDWWHSNRRLTHGIATLGLTSIAVRYEDLCQNRLATAERINAAFGTDLLATTGPMKSDTHHILVGNRMRHTFDGTLRYDDAWMARHEWKLAYKLLPPVRQANDNR